MLKQQPTFSWLLKHPVYFFAFGFGSGLAKKAPGTWGTLVALPITYLLFVLGISPFVLALSVIPLFILGIYFCQKTGQALGVSDYGGIVWDEIVAMMLVLSSVPLDWQWWFGAFVIFRLFDITKPWLIGYFDRKIHGGLGVMLDDLLAAFASMIVLYGIQSFIYSAF